MFKRPIIRPRRTPSQFVTETTASGSKVSYWAPTEKTQVVPNGAHGRVGKIIDDMRLGSDSVHRPAASIWVPPIDYEFIAKHMPECEGAEYTSRCEEWFRSHPPAIIAKPREVVNYDTELIAKLFTKYCPHTPPIDARVEFYRAAGYSEAYIAKAKVRAKMLVDTSDDRQKALDLIFAKWPAANKTDPKAKPKVIKAVKKRL